MPFFPLSPSLIAVPKVRAQHSRGQEIVAKAFCQPLTYHSCWGGREGGVMLFCPSFGSELVASTFLLFAPLPSSSFSLTPHSSHVPLPSYLSPTPPMFLLFPLSHSFHVPLPSSSALSPCSSSPSNLLTPPNSSPFPFLFLCFLPLPLSLSTLVVVGDQGRGVDYYPPINLAFFFYSDTESCLLTRLLVMS